MKKSILAMIALLFLCASCVKDAGNHPDQEKPSNFSYQTIKEVVASSAAQTSYVDVLNQDGDTIGVNILGNTPLQVSFSDVLTPKATKATKATKANGRSVIYFPNNRHYATMWFEDLFPNKGDYDMNDVAIGFRFTFQLNDLDCIETLKIDIQPRATGSSFDKIGLALAFNGPTLIKSVDYPASVNLSNFFSTDFNGVESGTASSAQTVIPITGDYRNHFEHRMGAMVNVDNKINNNPGQEFTVTIHFDKLVQYHDVTLFGADPDKLYNIDLFALFNERSREVHLKGMKASAKFDTHQFAPTGRTDFSDKNNTIWAIVIPKPISHPTEKTNIGKAFRKFDEWVSSNGDKNHNWYEVEEKGLVYDQKYLK